MKILFVASYVPPINGSATIRTLYYLNYLAEMGHTVHVLTIDYPKDFIRYDNSLEEKISKKVVFTKVTPGKMYLQIYPRKTKVEGGNHATKKPLVSRLKSIVKTNFIIPDSYIGWVFKAYAKGVELIKANNYDLMFSMHESPSCHLLAYRLKKRFKDLRWVGYYSDPWSQDPGRSKNPFWRRQVEFLLEKMVLKKMDKYLFTTEETKQMYIKTFKIPASATDLVYRGYDQSVYESIKQAPNPLRTDKINFVYTGDIYTSLRDLNPLIEALYCLKENDPVIYRQINLQLVGFIDNYTLQEVLRNFASVTLLARVAYDQSLSLMLHADVLLLWGNKNSNQIPGKIYEYFGTENIIFTILGDNTDPLKKVMSMADRGPIVTNTADEIYLALKNCIRQITTNTVPASYQKVVKKYEWENVVADLAEKLQA